MTDYASTATMPEIAARVRAATRIAVTTHARPDGDAVGSATALALAARSAGRAATVVLFGDIPIGVDELARRCGFVGAEDPSVIDEADLVVLLDTGSWSQVEDVADALRRAHDRTIGLDHHRQGDDCAPVRVVDPGCAATTQLVLRLLDELGWTITPPIADALYAGLATDTGWFRFANADAGVFADAARLAAAGADRAGLYRTIEEQHPPERLAIEARGLASIRWIAGGRAAIQTLRREDFAETGATPNLLTGLVNAPLAVRDCEVAVLLAEAEPGRVKASFRSKMRPGGPVDVNRLAQRFGGGGHVQAAGARLDGTLTDAAAQIQAAVESFLDGSAAGA